MNTGHDSAPHGGQVEPCLVVAEVGLRSDAVVVAVTGELDAATAAAFERRLAEILDGRPGRRVELDLSALEFCDLTGLRALHALGVADGEAPQQIRIIAAGPSLEVLLELCQIPAVLGYAPPAPPHDAG